MGSLEGCQGRFFGFSIAFLKLLFTKNCIPCICKKYFEGCLTFQLRFLKKKGMMYTLVIYCAFLTHISIFPCYLYFTKAKKKKKRLHYMQNIKRKGRIYVTGLLSRLTIKKYVFSAKAHSRTCSCIRNCISGFYLKIEFLFFRVSIVGILLSMEFEWASLGQFCRYFLQCWFFNDSSNRKLQGKIELLILQRLKLTFSIQSFCRLLKQPTIHTLGLRGVFI